MSDLMAPRGAVTHLAFHGRVDGIWIITWDMGGGKRKETLQMGAGPTLVYQMWERLDSHYDNFQDAKKRGDKDQERLWQVKARELAEILALFMRPHFTTGDAIVAEAVRRAVCRKDGIPVETAGVGSLRFTPPPGTTRPLRPGRSDPGLPERTRKKRPKGSIPADSVEGVRKALESGMDPIIIANLYKVTVEQVQALK